MAEISDDFMRRMLGQSRAYTAVLLRNGPNRDESPESAAALWEHGRRNFSLRADGLLAVVCPITDDSEWAGIGIFDASPSDVAEIMDGDPAVKAGVLTYQLHPVRGFPGDSLPGVSPDPAGGTSP